VHHRVGGDRCRRDACLLVEGRAEGGGEVRSVSEWAQVRALAADGVSQREIASRLGMNRRTVRRLVEAPEPPRYRREATGSILDPFDQVLRELVKAIEDIKAPRATELLRDDYGYEGSVDLVRRRLAELRPKEVPGAEDRLQAGAGDAGRLGGDAGLSDLLCVVRGDQTPV